MPEAVVMSDEQGKIVRVNSKAEALFDYTQTEMLQLYIESLVPEKVRKNHPKLREWFFKNPRPRHMQNRNYELSAVKKTGATFPMDASLFAIHTDKGPIAVNFIRDVSAIKAQHSKLSEMAFVDALTGLPNRHYFDNNFHRNLAKAKRHGDELSLLFVDLDGFKAINDTHGHEVGDQVLVEVANRFAHCVRQEDFLCRIGGDEFVVMIYPLKTPEAAHVVAKKLVASLEGDLSLAGLTLSVRASVGVAIYDDPSETDLAFFRRADKGMYLAKEKGGGCFVENKR